MWNRFQGELLGQHGLYTGLLAHQVLELGGTRAARHKAFLLRGRNCDAEGHTHGGTRAVFEDYEGSTHEGACRH
jgi:hypothetical protein